MKKISTIKTIDFLSPSVGLNINGNSSLQTFTGAAVSALFIGVFMTMSVMTVQDYFDTTTPKIAQEIVNFESYPTVNLKTGKHYPMIFFYKSGGSEIIPPAELDKYLTPRLTSYTFNYEVPGAVKVETHDLKIVPCSKLMDSNVLDTVAWSNDFVKGWLHESAMCIEAGSSHNEVAGGNVDMVISQTVLAMYPCILPSGCATQAEVEGVAFNMAWTDKISNFGDYQNPVKTILATDEIFSLNLRLTMGFYNTFMRNEIYDDKGFLFGKSLRANFTKLEKSIFNPMSRDPSQFECQESTIADGQCKPYVRIDYKSSGTMIKTNRSYQGFMDTLGQIGGIKEILFFILYYMYGFYHSKATTQYLVEEIFRVKKKSRSSIRGVNQQASKLTGVQGSRKQATRSFLEVDDKTYSKVSEVVMDTMNIVTIAKELNMLRTVLQFLMSEQAVQLSRWIGLEIRLAQKFLTPEEQKNGTKTVSSNTIFREIQTEGVIGGSPSVGIKGVRQKNKTFGDLFRGKSIQEKSKKVVMTPKILTPASQFPLEAVPGFEFKQPLKSLPDPEQELKEQVPESERARRATIQSLGLTGEFRTELDQKCSEYLMACQTNYFLDNDELGAMQFKMA